MKILYKEIKNCDECPCKYDADWRGYRCNFTDDLIDYNITGECGSKEFELKKDFLDSCPLEDGDTFKFINGEMNFKVTKESGGLMISALENKKENVGELKKKLEETKNNPVAILDEEIILNTWIDIKNEIKPDLEEEVLIFNGYYELADYKGDNTFVHSQDRTEIDLVTYWKSLTNPTCDYE